MSRDTVVSLVGAALFAVWAMAYSSGSDGWFVSAGSYVFPIVFGLCAVVIVLGIVLWVLKLLGVIAQLPFALDRKLNPPS